MKKTFLFFGNLGLELPTPAGHEENCNRGPLNLNGYEDLPCDVDMDLTADATVYIDVQTNLNRLRSLAFVARLDAEKLNSSEFLARDVPCSVTPVREPDGAHVHVVSADSLLGTTPCCAAVSTSPQRFELSLPSPPLPGGGGADAARTGLLCPILQVEATTAEAALDVEVQTELDRLKSLALEAMSDTERLNLLDVLIVSDVTCSLTPLGERGGAHVLVDSVDSLHDTTPCCVAVTTSPQGIEQSLPSPPFPGDGCADAARTGLLCPISQVEAATADAAVDVEVQMELDRLRSLALEAMSDIERLSPLEVLTVSDVNCSVTPVRERDGAHVLVDSTDSLLGTAHCRCHH